MNEVQYKQIIDRFATWYYAGGPVDSEWYQRLTAQVITDLENVLGRDRLEQLQGNSMVGEGFSTEDRG